ncbi:Peptide chain release factor RF2 [Buchnera aphidicola (Eriosoma grossulariae)]|uniref:peptide chain release factor 2 n=1 Tax=Buchnera aphidicola TaxID=9 RepID=UPI003A759088
MSIINSIKNKINEFKKHKKKLWRNLEYNKKQEKLKEIIIELNDSKTWENSNRLKNLNQEKNNIEKNINDFNKIDNLIQEIEFFSELIVDNQDNQIESEILSTIRKIEEKIKYIEFYHIFSNKNDHLNCYLDLKSGSGGIEAQDWTNILLRMYLRWTEKIGFKTEITNLSEGENTGIKSATLRIIGNYAFGWLRTESGIHRLVRKNPLNTGSQRHTSFSSVFVYADINDDIKINIHEKDIRIDVYRASGAGGQHVNKTESAVRITHLPTGMTTQCQNHRSQHKNKEQAMKQIQAKLYNLKIKQKNIEKNTIENKKSDIGWGKQIRSYILDQSKIKDLRTGKEHRNVQNILDGDLTSLILSTLTSGI